MVELLKAFGRGILYVILFPFFVLGLVLFAVIGLFAFIFQLIKSIIYFFTGQRFFPELPEDRELRLKREAAEAAANPIDPKPEPTYQPNPEPQPQKVVVEQYAGNNFVEEAKEEIETTQPSIEEAIFQQKEPEEEEQPIEQLGEDSLFGFLDEEKEEKKEPAPKVVETPVEEPEEEELEEYRPQGSSFVRQDNDDEDTDDNGLHIGFDN